MCQMHENTYRTKFLYSVCFESDVLLLQAYLNEGFLKSVYVWTESHEQLLFYVVINVGMRLHSIGLVLIITSFHYKYK